MARETDCQRRFVCTGCSLLCADVLTGVRDGDRVFDRVCESGRRWLDHALARNGGAIRVAGQVAPLEQAVQAAADRIADSRLPLIVGLADQSGETQLAAIRLARRIDAALDWTGDHDPLAWQEALQVTGRVTCSLEELRDQADLLVLWSTTPSAHPRLPDWFPTETVVIAGDADPEGPASAVPLARRLVWQPTRQLQAIRRLRESLAGITGADDPDDASWREELEWLRQRINDSRFCVLAVDHGLAEALGTVGVVDLSNLVRELNRDRRAALVHLAGQANQRGVIEVLTEQAAAPFGVLWREGQPLFRGLTATAPWMLERQEPDLLMVVGHRPFAAGMEQAVHNSQATKIRIGHAPVPADIEIPTAIWGIDLPGTAFRTDGMPRAVPGLRDSQWPDPVTVLDGISGLARSDTEIA